MNSRMPLVIIPVHKTLCMPYSSFDFCFDLLDFPRHLSSPIKMSGKYAFTKTLKEVRFLFCQTSDHSAATRFDFRDLGPTLC